jgi:hypothetical protein
MTAGLPKEIKKGGRVMNSRQTYEKIAFGCVVLFISLMTVSCSTTKSAVNADADGIAIKGYDTVAYFTMGKPVRGSDQFTYEWNGAKWMFSSREHLDLLGQQALPQSQ